MVLKSIINIKIYCISNLLSIPFPYHWGKIVDADEWSYGDPKELCNQQSNYKLWHAIIRLLVTNPIYFYFYFSYIYIESSLSSMSSICLPYRIFASNLVVTPMTTTFTFVHICFFLLVFSKNFLNFLFLFHPLSLSVLDTLMSMSSYVMFHNASSGSVTITPSYYCLYLN